jgi:hypothetical protein
MRVRGQTMEVLAHEPDEKEIEQSSHMHPSVAARV